MATTVTGGFETPESSAKDIEDELRESRAQTQSAQSLADQAKKRLEEKSAEVKALQQRVQMLMTQTSTATAAATGGRKIREAVAEQAKSVPSKREVSDAQAPDEKSSRPVAVPSSTIGLHNRLQSQPRSRIIPNHASIVPQKNTAGELPSVGTSTSKKPTGYGLNTSPEHPSLVLASVRSPETNIYTRLLQQARVAGESSTPTSAPIPSLSASAFSRSPYSGSSTVSENIQRRPRVRTALESVLPSARACNENQPPSTGQSAASALHVGESAVLHSDSSSSATKKAIKNAEKPVWHRLWKRASTMICGMC